MTDNSESFSIDFKFNKAGADAHRLAHELEEQIRYSARGGVEAKLRPNELGDSSAILTIVFVLSALEPLTKAISQFLGRHAISQFTIASEQSEIAIVPDMDSKRIKAAIEKLSGLPGDPTIDPPKPRKPRR